VLDVLNPRLVAQENFTHVVLSRALLPNGQDFDARRATAAWAHANYRKGRDAKIAFFRERGLWFLGGNDSAFGWADGDGT
jgi:hypothetical protein